MSERLFVADEAAMLTLGQRLAHEAKPGDLIYLQGPLGAGKTTLSRGFLQALGVRGSIKSPTFTLVEAYQVGELYLFHFDLYRLQDPAELSAIGLSDYLTEDAICLIEWPEKAGVYLPRATRSCQIDMPEHGEGRWVNLR